MTRTFCTVLGAAMLVSISALAAPAPEPDKAVIRKGYPLPTAKDAPVIELNQVGGLTARRVSHEPILTIYADGRVKMPACFEGQKALETKITAAQLQELLVFAIDEMKFFEHDEKKVHEKLVARGHLLPPTDSITTSIRIQIEGKDKLISGVNVSPSNPIEELGRFGQVKQRLDRLEGTLRIGGQAALDGYLKRVNEKLAAEQRGVEPLGMEHLRSVSVSTKGAREISFVRRVSTVNGALETETSASVYGKPGEDVTIRVGVNVTKH